mmetsp:Transcript_35293/g.89328  ORF Transcript_35293/g.89328 Transcript_35293/m.89328 type:complete len:648 (-) Transcript_35293:539-2482(-)
MAPWCHSTPEQRQQQLGDMQAAWQGLLQSCQEKEARIQAMVSDTTSSNGSPGSTPSGSPGPGPDPVDVQNRLSHSMCAAEGVPEELQQFWEAQRIIVMDAIRTDFKKNTLTTVEAITSWFNSAIADSSLYQRLSAREEGWAAGWLSGLARHQLSHATHFSNDQKRQVVRLIGLLSAYAVHDPETGYCQGMSDLALPFLLVLEDDALAFWCFEALMRKVRRNFAVEDSGIFAQLASLASLLERLDATLFYKLRQVGATDCHFAYRMIVVLMRRELPLDQALRLHEMLWADDMQHALGLTGPGSAAASAAAAAAAASSGSPSSSLITAASAPVDVLQQAAASRAASAMPDMCTPPAASAPISRRQTSDGAVEEEDVGSAERRGTGDTAVGMSGVSVSVPCTPSNSMRTDSMVPAGLLVTPSNTPMTAAPLQVAVPMAPLHTPTASPMRGSTQPGPWPGGSPTGAAMVESLQAAVPMLPSTHVRSTSIGNAGALAAFQHQHHVAVQAEAVPSSSGEAGSSGAPAAPAHAWGPGAPPGQPQLGLFMHFVAAVVIAQRRRILDDCTDSGDVMRAFQQVPSLRVDVADCMRRARVYRERDRRQAALKAQAEQATQQPQGPATPVQLDRELGGAVQLEGNVGQQAEEVQGGGQQ